MAIGLLMGASSILCAYFAFPKGMVVKRPFDAIAPAILATPAIVWLIWRVDLFAFAGAIFIFDWLWRSVLNTKARQISNGQSGNAEAK
jgi:hypothetical protein